MPTDTDDFDDFDDFNNFDDFDDFDDEAEPGLPWPPPPEYPPGTYPPPPGRANRTARRAGLLAMTAVVAGAAGFGVVAAALHDGTSASPGASAGSSPSAGSGSATPGGATRTQLPPPAGPGQQEFIEIGGKVEAVSAKSITVGGPGQSVTAAVTAATKVTGRVSRIGGVKVGDFVTVSITGTDGKFTAESIQDPASMS